MTREEFEAFAEVHGDIKTIEINAEIISRDSECQKQIVKLKKIECFLADFCFLTLGRDLVFTNKRTFSAQKLVISLELTMGNIISCCENGCIADACTLLRKYRDDLFFYLYIKVYDTSHRLNHKCPDAEKMRNRISSWVENEQKNLYVKEVLNAIESEPQIKEAVDKYNLRLSFDKIGRQLNNFVHSNGYMFYNHNISAYRNNEFFIELKSLADNAVYFTTVFIFLLALCSPSSIMSTDHIDYLECGQTPPEESQYWVAKFMLDYIQENSILIDEHAYAFLKDKCVMDL